MTDEKWGEIVGKARDQFEIIDEGIEGDSRDERIVYDFIVFRSPMGEIKLERKTSPRVLDVKTFGAHKKTIGSGAEFIYSPDEIVHTFKAYKKEDGEWSMMDGQMFE